MANEIRKSLVAGQFYPANHEKLKEDVKRYMSLEEDKNVKAVIAPHAGYPFSGELAGKTISRISEKEIFILLGVNHSGIGNNISFSKKDFETPLGIVENDGDATEKIKSSLEERGVDADFNEEAHFCEHSLEVLLPFLQEKQENFKIVPILLKDLGYNECLEIARVLSSFVGENVGIVVSSDFTHYGRSFGFVPFKEDVRKNLYELDGKVIKEIIRKNSEKVFNLASKSTICGMYGLTIITELAKIKEWEVEKVDYFTSGDITKHWNHVVGYGGVVFKNQI